jgi:hypothetical protein
MDTEFVDHEDLQPMGESATHPIELRCGTLAALLLLAGTRPQRPAQAKRRARLRQVLPAHRSAARSGAFNCRI